MVLHPDDAAVASKTCVDHEAHNHKWHLFWDVPHELELRPPKTTILSVEERMTEAQDEIVRRESVPVVPEVTAPGWPNTIHSTVEEVFEEVPLEIAMHADKKMKVLEENIVIQETLFVSNIVLYPEPETAGEEHYCKCPP